MIEYVFCATLLVSGIDPFVPPPLKDAMSEVDLKEECLRVGVVSVDANKKERRRSDERREDLRQLCQDADVLPLQTYMDTVVSYLDDS